MVLPTSALSWTLKKMFTTSATRFSANTGSRINKGKLLNIVGLPAFAVILFVMLPTYRPSEIHNIEYYYRNPDWREKKEE